MSKASARPKGAPAAGTAEADRRYHHDRGTLAANALKILDDGVILRSEANFVASLTAAWTDETREAARIILSRIAAEEVARTTREVSARVAQADVELFAHAEVMFAARARRHLSDGWLTLTCPKDKVSALADWLLMQGAAEVTVAQLDYVFAEKNKLYEKLAARLP